MAIRKNGSAEDRYTALAIDREPFLRRAREYAALTIPTLLPPEGHTRTEELPESYQSFGARCVTNLSSHLMTAFLPPTLPWFRLGVPPGVKLSQSEGDNETTEKGLQKSEDAIISEVERAGWRGQTYHELNNLIVIGNVMEQTLPDNTLKLYRLDQYVVRRDIVGRMIEMVIREEITKDALDESMATLVSTSGDGAQKKDHEADRVALYTWGVWDPDSRSWDVHQEIGTSRVPGSQGTYEILPFSALRWAPVLGEDYGRSKVEEHVADLRCLDGLSESEVDGAALASRHIQLVDPHAGVNGNLAGKLAKARNGDTLQGREEDVSMLQFTNVTGLQFTSQALATKKQEVGAAFLLSSAMRRDAERVTAYELRKMIEEIEGVLGGVYTTLSKEMQAPRLERLIFQMKRGGKLPPWPNGVVQPTIITGLDALGREKDFDRVMTFLQALQGVPDDIKQAYVIWSVLLNKASGGLQLSGAVRTEAEAQKELERMAQQAAVARGAPAQGENPNVG